MNEQKLMSLLGLAQKAGKVVSGEFAVEKAVKTGKARITIVACDASESTKKGYRDMTDYYKVPYFEHLTKQNLALSIGKVERAAVAITDDGFSRTILKLLSEPS